MSLLTLKEASEFTKLSVNTLRYYILRNDLRAIKLKRAVRLEKSDLDQWLKNNKTKVRAKRKELRAREKGIWEK